MLSNKKVQNLLALSLFLIILTPNLFVLFGNEEMDGMILKKVGYLLVSVACVALPALILRKRSYFLFEGFLSLFIAPIEIASVYLSHCTTNFMLMDTILSTNMSEATELLSSALPLVLFCLFVWIGYFFVTWKWVENKSFFSPKLRKIFLVTLPLLLLAGCSYFFVLARQIMTSESTTLKDNLIDMVDMMRFKFKKIFPFDVYIASGDVIHHHSEIREQQKHLASFRFGLVPKSESPDLEETVVLVIGETARYKNFGINGYERNTTPYLAQQKNLVSYTHFATMANLTSNSLPLIVTRANAVESDVANREKSISEAFSEAGYFTSWITDQEASSYLGRIVESCDFHHVINHGFSGKNIYDEELVAPFDSVLHMSHPKKFIVVHSMGSHFKYNQRYPSDFEQFTPCFNAQMDLMAMTPDNAAMLTNAYDNSILYTDYFLHSLVEKLEAKGGVWSMIFLSDHGENIFDDEKNLIMHGTLVVTPFEVHIPFLVLYSDEYADKNGEKIANILRNKDKNITSEVVFHSLLDMADIGSEIISDSLCIGREMLYTLDSTVVMNGNRELVPFHFSSFSNASVYK